MLSRFIIIFSSVICFSCSSNKQETTIESTDTTETVYEEEDDQGKKDSLAIAENGSIVFGWTGTINRKIPVFVNFWYQGTNVIGEIIYQDSKEKTPITLYGRLGNDGAIRMMEFDKKTGNITGIIQGIPTDESLYGTWFSPVSRKEYQIGLHRRESTKKLVNIKADPAAIAGTYGYQYGPNGAVGTLFVRSVQGNKIEFNINANTGGPSPNLADVENAKGIIENNTVVYKIPDSDNCEFKIEFFKGFASITYTKGYCEGQFGHNATVDGIFVKLN